jgi:hypothetical protein
MDSKTSDTERLATTEKRQKELLHYLELFAGAFDELHGAIIKQINTPGQYIGPHHDYPVMSMLDSGFPSFHEAGFNRDNSPRDYVGIFRPRGLFGLLGGIGRPEQGFPKRPTRN